MMKRKIIQLILFSSIVSVANASLINWTSLLLSADPEVGSSLTNGWSVALFQDLGGVGPGGDNTGSWYNDLRLANDATGTNVVSLGATGNDVFIGYTTVLENFISPANVRLKTVTGVDVTDNIDVYTVIYNDANRNNATKFLVVDSTPFGVGAHNPPQDYDLGDSISGDWQAIPEPAVAGLISIFGGGMLVARRLFSKS